MIRKKKFKTLTKTFRTFIESQSSETPPKNEGETNHDPDALRDDEDNDENENQSSTNSNT